MASTVYEFAYQGSRYVFTVPATAEYLIELYGAQGGGVTGVAGAAGGYIKGKARLNAGDILYIYVGGQGSGRSGGWNGGGNGSSGTSGNDGAGGGGATDIRLNSDSLNTRIAVAGGGGGAGGNGQGGGGSPQSGTGGGGGAGGGTTGASGSQASISGDQSGSGGGGGTQTYGGSGGSVNSTSYNNSDRTYYPAGAGGGGGGYYGGGGGGGGSRGGANISVRGGVGISGGRGAGGSGGSAAASGTGYYSGGGGGGGGGSSYAGSMTEVTHTQAGRAGNGFARLTVTSSAAVTDAAVSPSTVHKQDTTLTAKVSSSSGEKVRYRVTLRGSVFVNWTAYTAGVTNVSVDIPNSALSLGNNALVITAQAEGGGEDTKTLNIVKSNNLPSFTWSGKDSIHLENLALSLVINDLDGDTCRFRAAVNGEEAYPWSSFNTVPFTVTLALDNGKFRLGSNVVTIYMEDDFGGTSTGTVNVSKVNNLPEAKDFRVEGATVKAVVEDADGDKVRYSISVNGTKLAPDAAAMTDFASSPISVWFTIPEGAYRIGESNLIRLDIEDDLGGKDFVTVSQVMGYAGLVFHDESGQNYSSDVAEVVRLLDAGRIIAGGESAVHKVLLTNAIGYRMKNIRLWVNQRDLDGVTTWAELSYTGSPFTHEPVLMFPVLEHGETVELYVKVLTTITGVGEGKFDIIVEADPL